MAEESREPGTVAGTQAAQDGPAPATGEPAVADPAPLVPGARELARPMEPVALLIDATEVVAEVQVT